MSILIVVAHPDDEVLGCGATAATLSSAGRIVSSCILAASVEARRGRPELNSLMTDLNKAHAVLGIIPAALGDFPNIRLNTVPHIELVQFIEKAIADTDATTIFTHHPADVNDDHRHVAHACQAAARLFQRRSDVANLRGLYFMEVLSATDWSFPDDRAPFRANSFFEVGEDALQRKLDALNAYRGVMRPHPHPRSERTIRGLAAVRGAQAGMHCAEAFQAAFTRLGARGIV